ncbi:hypothetical protein N7548_00125 [Acholeplasma manati]|uniref:Uncharacterized protein n=1 Tax=Paracholeplasma manati TaxID=591373 RepID=A0ABT2Y3B9_9MOLU|nr:hypothetical protein [Paracholeplasma manati]MCV2231231.1 hypothetical protein [Paracholeplasma manati]
MKVNIPINQATQISYTINQVIPLPDFTRTDNGMTFTNNVVLYLLFKVNHGEVPEYCFFTGAPHILGKIVSINTIDHNRYVLVQLMTQGESYLQNHIDTIEQRMKERRDIVRYRGVGIKTIRLNKPVDLDITNLISEFSERHPNY